VKRLLIYVDASVIGGCEDDEFATHSRALWDQFARGEHTMALSAHTLRELLGAPTQVQERVGNIPEAHTVVLTDSEEAEALADTYIERGCVGPGSRADALHVALATVGRVDVLVSWNFKHIVNLGRIRLFNSVNLVQGYGTLEIRTPQEVQDHD